MNGGALAHVGFPRPVQQVHIGRALGGTQTTRIIDLAGALVGSNPGHATTGPDAFQRLGYRREDG